VCGTKVVFAEVCVFEGMVVHDVVVWRVVKGVGVLAWEVLRCKVVKFVSSKWRRAEEGSKIEWGVPK